MTVADPTADALRSAVLVDASELAHALAGDRPPVVLAVRPPEPPATGAWQDAERIPGAVETSLAADFAAPSSAAHGSRPLPALADLEARARRWGLSPMRETVVYDHDGGLQAARAWWVLRWAGLQRVRLLNGGFAAWRSAGLATDAVATVPRPSDVMLDGGHLPQLDADAAARLARTGVLIDSRIRPNYEGGATPEGAPPRGHIPGAVNVPAPANLDAAGAFLGAAALRALYAAAGVDASTAVGVYCGAGVSAAHDVLALASIGIAAPMYVGSWSAWSADPRRPVATGAAPG